MVAEHIPQPDKHQTPLRLDVAVPSQFDTGVDSVVLNALIITGRQAKRHVEDLGDTALIIGATVLLAVGDGFSVIKSGLSHLPKI